MAGRMQMIWKPKALLSAANFRKRFQFCRQEIEQSKAFQSIVKTLEKDPYCLMPTSKADLNKSFRIHQPFLETFVYPLAASTHPKISFSTYLNHFKVVEENFNFITPEALTEGCLKLPPTSLSTIYAQIAASDLRIDTSQFSDGRHKGLILNYPRYVAQDFPVMEFDAASNNCSVGFGVSFRMPKGDIIDNIYGQLDISHIGGLVSGSTGSDFVGSSGGLGGSQSQLLHPLHGKDFPLYELGAMIRGLQYNKKVSQFDRLAIFGNSDDVINVLEGFYSIPEYGFEEYVRACGALRRLVGYSIHHIYSEENLLADALAECGLNMTSTELLQLIQTQTHYRSWHQSKYVQQKLESIMGYDMEAHSIIPVLR